MLQPNPEFLNPDDFPEPHMEPVARVSEAERLAGIWDDYLPAYHYGHVAKDTAAELRRLAAVERERDEDQGVIAVWRGRTQRAEADRDRLAAEVEALRADAERYRVLRRGQHWSVINGAGDTLRADELDAAIDAAKKEGK